MPELKRELRLFDVVTAGVGLILGAGIYSLIGSATGMTGNSVWMSFFVAAFIASLTGLSYAELSTMFTKSAAEYLYVKNSFGSNLPAFLIGWLEIFADVISISTVALAFGGYFSGLFGGSILISAIGLILVLSLVNFLGIKESSRINVIFTFIEIAGLFLIIFLGIPHLGSVNYFEFPYGFFGVFKGAGIIFFAYLGFEEIVNIGEEVKNPKKTLPRAIIISTVVSTIIYILVALSSVSIMNWKDVASSNAPLAQIASSQLGNSGFLLMSLIALFAISNTALMFLLVASRMIYGMSNDGSLPKVFSKVHSKTRTPYLALLTATILSIFFVLLGNIVITASLVDFVVFLIFIFVNLSLIILRYKMPDVERKFKVPLNIGKFPLIPFFGLIFSFFMLFHFDFSIFLVIVGATLVGYVVYSLYSKFKV